MRKSKLVCSVLSLAFYIAAFIGLFCPFIWQLVVHKGGVSGGSNNGLEVGLNFAAFPQNLPNLMVIVGIAIGLVCSLIFSIVNLAKYSKVKKKGAPEPKDSLNNGRLIACLLIFGVLCGVVPFLCASLTLDAYGIANPELVHGRPQYYLGEGAIISAVCSLVGGILLYNAESGFLD